MQHALNPVVARRLRRERVNALQHFRGDVQQAVTWRQRIAVVAAEQLVPAVSLQHDLRMPADLRGHQVERNVRRVGERQVVMLHHLFDQLADVAAAI